jgi:RNA polymerase sigma factor (sigma-70 family)
MVSEQLVKRCMKNDRKAHHELYKISYGILMSVCIRYRKNESDAAELMNTGFLKVLNSMKSYKVEIPFEAWVRRIMINTIISDYHKNKKYKESVQYTEPAFERLEKNADYNLGDSNLGIEIILKAMDNLPEMSRKVLNLYVFDGMTHDEIACFLGISQGTSKWHLHEARKKMKNLLRELSY